MKLRQLMEAYRASSGAMHPNVAESRTFIREHLLLRHVNQQRWQILNDLFKLRREPVWA